MDGVVIRFKDVKDDAYMIYPDGTVYSILTQRKLRCRLEQCSYVVELRNKANVPKSYILYQLLAHHFIHSIDASNVKVRHLDGDVRHYQLDNLQVIETLYLMVSNDKYELPVWVESDINEVAKKLGKTVHLTKMKFTDSWLARNKRKAKKYRLEKVEINLGDQEWQEQKMETDTVQKLSALTTDTISRRA